MSTRTSLFVLALALGLAAHAGAADPAKTATAKFARKNLPAKALKAKIVRFVPTDIQVDTSRLSVRNKAAVGKLIQAAKLMDGIFLRQVWSGNVALKAKLEADQSAVGKDRLHYFTINVGPWSRLDLNEPFLAGVPAHKPPEASFYPDGITKEELQSWLDSLPEAEKAKATGYFTVIRRDEAGKLKAIPYSEEYREFLEPAAKLLREAAALTDNASLKKYLRLRADAFLSNDYYESDCAWIDLDSPIEPTVGPYETYEDELMGYKAAFEGYVTLRDDAETAKLSKFSDYMQELEDNLPMPDKYKNPKLGACAPIRVVDELIATGDGNRGYQVSAFNLPNDEKVVKEKGAKRTMLRNIQLAKFDKLLVPIAKVTLVPALQKDVDFEAFFTFVLCHELTHGIGPQQIEVGGQKTTPRQQLKELYSATEETKADLCGMWAMQYLVDKGVIDKRMGDVMYTTFLASAFRSVRFGINEAHGKGIALQFNYLVDEGAFLYDEKTETFSVDPAKVKEGFKKLATELLTCEATGDYARVKALFDKYVVIRPPMQKALDKMKDIPVDIEAIYLLQD